MSWNFGRFTPVPTGDSSSSSSPPTPAPSSLDSSTLPDGSPYKNLPVETLEKSFQRHELVAWDLYERKRRTHSQIRDDLNELVSSVRKQLSKICYEERDVWKITALHRLVTQFSTHFYGQFPNAYKDRDVWNVRDEDPLMNQWPHPKSSRLEQPPEWMEEFKKVQPKQAARTDATFHRNVWMASWVAACLYQHAKERNDVVFLKKLDESWLERYPYIDSARPSICAAVVQSHGPLIIPTDMLRILNQAYSIRSQKEIIRLTQMRLAYSVQMHRVLATRLFTQFHTNQVSPKYQQVYHFMNKICQQQRRKRQALIDACDISANPTSKALRGQKVLGLLLPLLLESDATKRQFIQTLLYGTEEAISTLHADQPEEVAIQLARLKKPPCLLRISMQNEAYSDTIQTQETLVLHYGTKKGDYIGNELKYGSDDVALLHPDGTLVLRTRNDDIIHAMTEALNYLNVDFQSRVLALGKKFTLCCNCGRLLSDALSLERGLGTHCWKHLRFLFSEGDLGPPSPPGEEEDEEEKKEEDEEDAHESGWVPLSDDIGDIERGDVEGGLAPPFTPAPPTKPKKKASSKRKTKTISPPGGEGGPGSPSQKKEKAGR